MNGQLESKIEEFQISLTLPNLILEEDSKELTEFLNCYENIETYYDGDKKSFEIFGDLEREEELFSIQFIIDDTLRKTNLAQFYYIFLDKKEFEYSRGDLIRRTNLSLKERKYFLRINVKESSSGEFLRKKMKEEGFYVVDIVNNPFVSYAFGFEEEDPRFLKLYELYSNERGIRKNLISKIPKGFLIKNG